MITSITGVWEVVVTHVPSGLSARRTGRHFRNQNLAKESAIRYLKSRIFYEVIESTNLESEISVTEIPDENMWPDNLNDFRRKAYGESDFQSGESKSAS